MICVALLELLGFQDWYKIGRGGGWGVECNEKLMYAKEAKIYTQKCEENFSCMVLALSPADIREYLWQCSFVIGNLRAEMSERQLWIVIFSPGIQNMSHALAVYHSVHHFPFPVIAMPHDTKYNV